MSRLTVKRVYDPPAPADGTRILVDVRGKDVPAVVVPTPFYKRPSA